ncbi:MAG: VOC family protein [Alphaproteobacteria bacterium]
MIGYITLGTSDLARAAAFYDALCAEFGVGRFMEFDTFIAWGKADACGVALTKPFDGKPATVGNGVMVAFQADSREMVDRVYAQALALGARDEGAAGPRGEGGFYGGYFRDPDGNKLNVFHMPAPG